MLLNTPIAPGPTPQDQDRKQISLVTKVYYDGHGFTSDFGYVLIQPRKSYTRGETVICSFVSGNPRNNLMTNSSYFYVERLNQDNSWTIVATDANWETKFRWIRTSTIMGRSEIEFYWDVPYEMTRGEYRVRHKGYFRYILGGVYPYHGSTEHFRVL